MKPGKVPQSFLFARA